MVYRCTWLSKPDSTKNGRDTKKLFLVDKPYVNTVKIVAFEKDSEGQGGARLEKRNAESHSCAISKMTKDHSCFHEKKRNSLFLQHVSYPPFSFRDISFSLFPSISTFCPLPSISCSPLSNVFFLLSSLSSLKQTT